MHVLGMTELERPTWKKETTSIKLQHAMLMMDLKVKPL